MASHARLHAVPTCTSCVPVVGAQDTVADMAKDMRDSRTGSAAASAEELYQFMQKVSFVAD